MLCGYPKRQNGVGIDISTLLFLLREVLLREGKKFYRICKQHLVLYFSRLSDTVVRTNAGCEVQILSKYNTHISNETNVSEKKDLQVFF